MSLEGSIQVEALLAHRKDQFGQKKNDFYP